MADRVGSDSVHVDPLVEPDCPLRDSSRGPVCIVIDREDRSGNENRKRSVGVTLCGVDKVADDRTWRTGANDPADGHPLPRGECDHIFLSAFDVHGSADPNLHIEPHGPDLCSIVLSHNNNSYLNGAEVIKPGVVKRGGRSPPSVHSKVHSESFVSGVKLSSVSVNVHSHLCHGNVDRRDKNRSDSVWIHLRLSNHILCRKGGKSLDRCLLLLIQRMHCLPLGWMGAGSV